MTAREPIFPAGEAVLSAFSIGPAPPMLQAWRAIMAAHPRGSYSRWVVDDISYARPRAEGSMMGQSPFAGPAVCGLTLTNAGRLFALIPRGRPER